MNIHRPLLHRFLILQMLGTLGTGCTSLVYSPSATLPSKPLANDQGQVVASANLLPETGGGYAKGGELVGRYALSDRVTLQARFWSRLENLRYLELNGFSVESLIMLNDSTSAIRYGLMPRAEFMLNGRSIDGRAGFLTAVAWLPKVAFLQPYIGLGTGAGMVTVDNNNESTGYTNYWGYAILANVGTNMKLFGSFGLNAELSGVLQFNAGDGSIFRYILPSLGVAWSF